MPCLNQAASLTSRTNKAIVQPGYIQACLQQYRRFEEYPDANSPNFFEPERNTRYKPEDLEQKGEYASVFQKPTRQYKRFDDFYHPKITPKAYQIDYQHIPSGRRTTSGEYVMLRERLPRYVVPDLTGFKLKPYVEDVSLNEEQEELFHQGYNRDIAQSE